MNSKEKSTFDGMIKRQESKRRSEELARQIVELSAGHHVTYAEFLTAVKRAEHLAANRANLR